MGRYSQEFKDRAVARLLPPESASITTVFQEHRGRARAPQKMRPPSTHIATAINQVWTWDMTFVPAEVLGRFFYLYLVYVYPISEIV